MQTFENAQENPQDVKNVINTVTLPYSSNVYLQQTN